MRMGRVGSAVPANGAVNGHARFSGGHADPADPLHAGPTVPTPVRRVGRRYHAHFPGVVYVVTTLVLVLGALNGQNNLLFALFGLAVGGLIVSGILSGANLIGISVERLPPAHGAVGEPLFVRYRVSNRNWLIGAFGVTIEELEESRRARRKRGAPPLAGRLHSPLRVFAAYVPARGSIIVEARALGLRRGIAELRRFRAISTFPFGLTKKSVLFEQLHSVRVRPRPAPVRSGLLRAGGGGTPRGGRLQRWRGGDEFWALREFSPGDSLRSVAWRPSARMGQVLVRDMARASARRFWIELDVEGADPQMTERAICIAAGLFAQAHQVGCPVGLRESRGIVLAPIRSGRSHLGEALDALAAWPRTENSHPATDSAEGSEARGDTVAVISVCGDVGSASPPDRVWAGDPSLVTTEFDPSEPETQEGEPE